MRETEKAQALLLAAIFLLVLLIMMVLIADGAWMFIEQQGLKRAADMSCKSGLILVGDLMTTQISEIRALQTPTPMLDGRPGSESGTQLATPAVWQDLTDIHRSTLTAPPMQTLVADRILETLKGWGMDPGRHKNLTFEIQYPYQYYPDGDYLQAYLFVSKELDLLLGSRLLSGAEIHAESIQTIPQR